MTLFTLGNSSEKKLSSELCGKMKKFRSLISINNRTDTSGSTLNLTKYGSILLEEDGTPERRLSDPTTDFSTNKSGTSGNKSSKRGFSLKKKYQKLPHGPLQKAISVPNLRKPGEPITVELRIRPISGIGIFIDGGTEKFDPIYVRGFKNESAALNSGMIDVGDRILKINNISFANVSKATAQSILESIEKPSKGVAKSIRLTIQKKEDWIAEDNSEDSTKLDVFEMSNRGYNTFGEGGSGDYKNVDDEDMSGIRGTYFRDGRRKIDFVLVYEEGEKPTDEKYLKFREKFLSNLKKSKVEMEEETTDDKNGTKVVFIKCHCPFDVLKYYAEELSFKAPLERRKSDKINWSERILEKLHLPNPFYEGVPNTPPDYFTCTFQADKFHLFIGSETPETYFTDTERTRVCYEILETAPYGRRQKGEIGVERLVAEGVFTAGYPLHVGRHKRPREEGPDSPGDEPQLNQRQVLKAYWGRWGKWLKYQPLDHIRAYFGEKIGLYFAWLGQYTAWLLLPSFVGLLVFLYGVATIKSPDNRDALDICEFGANFSMCPRCDEKIGCKPWILKDSCGQAMISYLFDNAATVFFAIFVSFWAVFFLEFWKRKEITLAYQWDCLDYESEVERPRPTFAALAPTVERNPVTGIPEPHFPAKDRAPRIYSGIMIIVTMVSLVLIFMLGVIVYKLLVYRPLAANPLTAKRALQIANISGAVCNLICIMILSRVYEKVAQALTHWEMHRTQTEYEDNLTFKVFVFQFVNFYASIFYIAFFKGKFIGYPGHYTTLFGLRMEECGPGGCLIELAQQLVIIMVGKQMIGNIQEVAIPLIKQKLKKRKRGKKAVDLKPRWEDDYELVENEGLFAEYLEMVIQFGFITIFVAAFPLAPFFALANNVFEIRIDSNKLICETRRPIADRAQDLGIWYNILDAVAKIAVISNAFLIAFTSNFLPKLLYRYTISPNGSLDGYLNFSLAHSPPNSTGEPCRYRDFREPDGSLSKFYWHLLALKLGFVILFEHFIFATHQFIDFLVPDIPEELDVAIKREAYRAKKALSDHPTLNEGSEDELDEKNIDIRTVH